MTSPPLILLPGYTNSGPDHWQSRWQAGDPRISRFAPTSWSEPVLDDWLDALDRAVAAAASPPLLVAHSLSCLLIAHWAARRPQPIAGAMLVAVPDPALPRFPAAITGFDHPPTMALPFPTLVVASSDDPYARSDFGSTMAACWGARYVDIGACGHINPAAGITDWPQGRALLEAFEHGILSQALGGVQK